MSPIEDVARLKELEGDATPEKWIEERGQVITLDEIDIDGEGDRQIEIPYDMDDAVFISQIRNAAPWLLAVAGQFQAGDAAMLRAVLQSIEKNDYDAYWVDCLRRMLAAARIMEGQG